jgi:hypothetical protein
MAEFQEIEHKIGDIQTIADMTSIPERTVRAILKGERNPETEKGKRIVRALEILKQARSQKVA